MRSSINCLPCFVKQAIDASNLVIKDEEKIHKVLKKSLNLLSDFNLEKTPPEAVQELHNLIRNELNCKDPYKDLKQMSIKRALSIKNMVLDKINQSDDRFEAALRFAIAGNIMDFGLKAGWDEKNITSSFENALIEDIDLKLLNELKQKVKNSNKILYLGDNAGESVFDAFLIKEFHKEKSNVFYAVKGSPILNDVVLKDAKDSKIDEVATIIENGSNVPGTVLSQCSNEFVKLFNQADLIISKGQGNFETLNESKKDIYFLLQIKCPVLADHYGFKKGDWKILNGLKLNL